MIEHPPDDSILKMIGASSVTGALVYIWGRMMRVPRPTQLTRAEVLKLLDDHSKAVKGAAYFDERLKEFEERHGKLQAMIEGIDDKLSEFMRQRRHGVGAD